MTVEIYVETCGPETVAAEKIQAAIEAVFDLRPAAIIDELDVLRPMYSVTAAGGHLRRTSAGAVERPFTWEQTDRVDALRSAIR